MCNAYLTRRTMKNVRKGRNLMNKISRKGFLKIAAAAAMSGVTAGALSACNSSSSSVAASGASVYTAGTYTATAKGMNDITVTMTFSDTAITEVKVDTANETLDLAVNSAADFQTCLLYTSRCV